MMDCKNFPYGDDMKAIIVPPNNYSLLCILAILSYSLGVYKFGEIFTFYRIHCLCVDELFFFVLILLYCLLSHNIISVTDLCVVAARTASSDECFFAPGSVFAEV